MRYTWKGHFALVVLSVFVLAPLASVAAAFMNYKMGFYIAGSVLTGILGSIVAIRYGSDGRHGANYIQTLCSSASSLAGMVIIEQVIRWRGMPDPPLSHMFLFLTGAGMFGTGIGALLTPVLVDFWKLTYPSGKAVSQILQVITDPKLLKAAVSKIGFGGFLGGLGALVALPGGFSGSAVGAGLIINARIAVPGFLVGVIGLMLEPSLHTWGWIKEGQVFRHYGFYVGLAMILGASVVKIFNLFAFDFREIHTVSTKTGGNGQTGLTFSWPIFAWSVFWAVLLVVMGTSWFGMSGTVIVVAIVLTGLFCLINGIATGVADQNPISAAFVLSLLLLKGMGLTDVYAGLFAAGLVLIGTGVGVEMQEDRSVSRRLGSNRTVQFWYQIIGVPVGALCTIVLSAIFLKAFPELLTSGGTEKFSSAMTVKLNGALEAITTGGLQSFQVNGIIFGLVLGVTLEVLRRIFKDNLKRFSVDVFLLISPTAAGIGAFLGFYTLAWMAAGGVITSVLQWHSEKKQTEVAVLPEEMSGTSLFGGGLIAGEALATVGLGLYLLSKALQ